MDIYEKIKNLKIMLIDDDEWIRDSLTILFHSEGCDLLALETAEEGLEAMDQQVYDIVISDYKLPGMDGLKFLNRVKDKQPNAIKILISAYGNDDILAEARCLGVQEFIPKPFNSNILEASLSALLESRS